MARFLPLLTLAAALSSPAQAETPTQFNLDCTGVLSKKLNGQEFPATPFSNTYRVDLQSNTWCAGDCDSPQEIFKVTETEIILSNSKDAEKAAYTTVNRRTGEFMQGVSLHPAGGSGSLDVVVLANCKPATFVPIPKRMF